VDLAALIDPQRDAVAGKWARTANGTALAGEPGIATRLEIPFQPPQEYDLKVVLSREAGDQELALILGREKEALHWMIGRDNLSTGFQLWAKDTDYINNPTVAHIPNCLENGRQYTVVIQMRKNEFHAFINGELRSSWRVGDAFGTLKSWTMPTPGLLGLGSSHSRAVFHSIHLLEITGKGQRVEAAAKRLPAQLEPPRRVDSEPVKAQRPPAPPTTDF
jgi:hypothetical protein